MTSGIGLTHSERVRQALETEILSGQLAPGTTLDEEALARRFSVSRTPVREAILQLVETGLVEKKPRKGAIVARTDVSDVIQLFAVMSELEAICAKFAARRMTAAERHALADLHAKSEVAFHAGDNENYYRLSRQFHLAIIAGSHNRELIEITNRLGLKLVPYRRFQLFYPGQAERNLRDHAEILHAILEGHSERAAELFRKHTTVQGEVLAEFIAVTSAEAKSAENPKRSVSARKRAVGG